MPKNNKKTIGFSLKSLFTLALLTLTLACAGAGSALAAEGYAPQKAGFTGPGPDLVTVQQALTMGDDAIVSLRGNIAKSLGDEHYLFQDATGSIEVEIDDDDWRGQQVGPEDTVLITGEVDRGWSKITIDVDRLVKQ